MNREEIIKKISNEREVLERNINNLIDKKIKHIPIANKSLMPFGWRKSAKGRTVWRIVEEVISQNLEKYAEDFGFKSVVAAESEVGVYDFEFELETGSKSYVNIKTAVIDGRVNKDDISKADGLIDFLKNNIDNNIYVATFLIKFTEDMTIELVKCIICPTAWIPDVYVKPRNNGKLQSSKYKRIEEFETRTNSEFLRTIKEEKRVAKLGGRNKLRKLIEKGSNPKDIAESLEISLERLKEML